MIAVLDDTVISRSAGGRFNGPTTIRSQFTVLPSFQSSLVTKESPGNCRSVCQQAESSRANSVSSVRINALVLGKEVRSLAVFSACLIRHSRESKLLGVVEGGQQTLCADAQIYGRLGVLGLLRYLDSLLQTGDLDTRDRQDPIE
jgi:hypothetical protein